MVMTYIGQTKSCDTSNKVGTVMRVMNHNPLARHTFSNSLSIIHFRCSRYTIVKRQSEGRFTACHNLKSTRIRRFSWQNHCRTFHRICTSASSGHCATKSWKGLYRGKRSLIDSTGGPLLPCSPLMAKMDPLAIYVVSGY
jgi:hypothetical protein